MRWRWWTGVALALAVCVVFFPAVHGGWLSLDDDAYVLTNPLVRGGFRAGAIADAFTSTRGDTWIPLAWLSHMLDVTLFGLDPAGHHLTSVLLHAVNAAILFAVLARLTGAPMRSALVAALFAMHPLRVESVAWIAERKDVLSACFSFLTMGAYARWVERPSAARYGLVLGGYALALAAKPMAVTLPVLLLLLDVWPLRRGARGLPRLVIEKLPLFALAAAEALVILGVAGAHGLLADVHPFSERASNALVSYVRYFGSMVWPVRLAVYYPFPPPWPIATVLVAAGMLVAMGIAALLLARRAPYVAVGYAWYLVSLLPVIGFTQVGAQGLADRFTYVPMVGVLVAVVWGAGDLAARSAPMRAAAGLTAGLALGLLVGQTRVQLGYWRDAETLYTRTLAVTERNCLIQHNLGELQLRRGAFDEAIASFRRALELEPRYAQAAHSLGIAHNNLGALLLRQGASDEALGHFATALHFDPQLTSAQQNFRNALAEHGVPAAQIDEYVRVAIGRVAQAIGTPGSAD
jgi:tetratricopeptide (TPR) repeat protein